MTTLKALETSLYWQRVVYRDSKDPAQRERVKARIAKLEAQIALQDHLNDLAHAVMFGMDDYNPEDYRIERIFP